MPRAEVNDIAATYNRLDYAWQAYQPIIPLLAHCTAYYTQTDDVSTLSPPQIATEIDWIKQTMAMEAVYGNTLSEIGRQPDFGPVPSWWQMLPFFKMEDYYKWVAAHPEIAARSDADLDATKAHAGLPGHAFPDKTHINSREQRGKTLTLGTSTVQNP